ncbi:DNA-binding response regulator [Flavobacterium piscis]|jgi:two-component system nitrate/nitrite response regulator NarL|uniref:DNA-binding response regulator n=1 Tax=Flavobacterium piscis TaxID=1114874 RepID=A0ABX2XG29_9FLAO|nr:MULTISPECIES: response regulator transcription factor [Flavobacterium]MCA1919342.1 response regulator transcription factor [Flavobacterium piscis]OCB71910.1 DNA-binding response regulator [Flavobacterium piscis]OXG00991.1 DNA-binding response regulator [Flavobacterium piscis]QDW22656.1 response regulator transcription factor [Flavobacterium sp. KBS0721]
MSNIIRVVLADDHVFVRDGIKSLLENEANIEVVGEAIDGADALEVVAQNKPDLLIVDIRMPHLTGIEVVEKLRGENNNVKIIMLSMHESEEYVLKSIKAGADGYLLKGSSKEEFLKALHTVAAGGKYFSGDISSILISQLTNSSTSLEPKQSLADEMMITKREKEILTLLLSGKGNKEIAEALDISKRTAEVHRFNLMKKLKVKNLMELSNKATEYSLL